MSSVPLHHRCTWVLSVPRFSVYLGVPQCTWVISVLQCTCAVGAPWCTWVSGTQSLVRFLLKYVSEYITCSCLLLQRLWVSIRFQLSMNCVFQRHCSCPSASFLICLYSMPYETWMSESTTILSIKYGTRSVSEQRYWERSSVKNMDIFGTFFKSLLLTRQHSQLEHQCKKTTNSNPMHPEATPPVPPAR